MSVISQIRSMIQDKPVHQEDTFVLADGQTRFQTKYFPIDPASVIITVVNTPYSVTDVENGLITFSSAPGADIYGIEYSCLLLSDQSIQDIIDMESGTAGTDDIRIIAADCLDAIASQQAIILKRIKILDLDIDGPALAKELRAHAKNLRDLAFQALAQESTFDIAEQINDLPGWKEKITKDWYREIG